MKHTYWIEWQDPTLGWTRPLGSDDSLVYWRGYLDRHRECGGPRLACRIVRGDGKVIEEVPAIDDATIGAVAGFPTWQQYARAAAGALERGAQIAMCDDDAAIDTAVRLRSAAIVVLGTIESGARR